MVVLAASFSAFSTLPFLLCSPTCMRLQALATGLDASSLPHAALEGITLYMENQNSEKDPFLMIV